MIYRESSLIFSKATDTHMRYEVIEDSGSMNSSLRYWNAQIILELVCRQEDPVHLVRFEERQASNESYRLHKLV